MGHVWKSHTPRWTEGASDDEALEVEGGRWAGDKKNGPQSGQPTRKAMSMAVAYPYDEPWTVTSAVFLLLVAVASLLRSMC
jgi:hypothetical protein